MGLNAPTNNPHKEKCKSTLRLKSIQLYPKRQEACTPKKCISKQQKNTVVPCMQICGATPKLLSAGSDPFAGSLDRGEDVYPISILHPQSTSHWHLSPISTVKQAFEETSLLIGHSRWINTAQVGTYTCMGLSTDVNTVNTLISFRGSLCSHLFPFSCFIYAFSILHLNPTTHQPPFPATSSRSKKGTQLELERERGEIQGNGQQLWPEWWKNKDINKNSRKHEKLSTF